MKPILCVLGLHDWPLWRRKKASKVLTTATCDDVGKIVTIPNVMSVRVCKRKGCKLRQERYG